MWLGDASTTESGPPLRNTAVSTLHARVINHVDDSFISLKLDGCTMLVASYITVFKYHLKYALYVTVRNPKL